MLVYSGQLLPGWAASGGDIAAYADPYDRYIGRAWQQGRIPLWNPDLFMGVPLLANMQAESLYPPNLILLFLPADVALAWSTAAHIAMAGAGMYMYAWRSRGLGRIPAAVAASVFMLGPYLTAHLAHVNQIHTLAWAPWLMLACDRAVRRPHLRWAPAIAVLVGLVILAGHPQQAYFTLVLGAIAAAAPLWPHLQRRSWLELGRRVPVPLAGVGLGFALSAVQLLPTIELAQLSYRSGGLGRGAVESSLHLKGLLATALPHYSTELPPEIAGAAIGAPALFLALIAVGARWRKPWVPVWTAISLAAFWAATGEAGRFYPLLVAVVPGLGAFRAPERLLVFTDVGVSLLAGLGVRTVVQLSQVQRRRSWRGRGLSLVSVAALVALVPAAAVAAGALTGASGSAIGKLVYAQHFSASDVALAAAFVITIATVCLAGLRWPSSWRLGLALLALAGIESWAATEPIYSRHPVPAAVYGFQSRTQDVIAPDPNVRYLSLIPPLVGVSADDRAHDRFSPDQRAQLAPYIGLGESLAPNTGIGTGRPNVDGYDGGLLPLRTYVDFRAPALPPGTDNRPDYVIPYMTSTVAGPEWPREAAVAAVITDGSDPNPPGCQCWVAGSRTGAVTIWHPAGQRPSRAWVEAAGRRLPAQITRDTGERVDVEVPMSNGGTLVLADAVYPGWRATVDGVEQPIHTYHGFLRSVDLPAGARQVTFSFDPVSVRVGAWISGLAMLLTVGLAVVPRSRPAGRLQRPGSDGRVSSAPASDV